jgi:hypothetical protein
MATEKQVTLADVERILQAEEHDTLVRMILGWAAEDERLRERLILYAASRSGTETGAAAVRRAFQRAIRVPGYVNYREAYAWAHGVHEVIGSIEQLRNNGRAAAAIELCESALQSLTDAIQSVDDSDGHFAGLRDRLQEIHCRACQDARPEPAALARRLFAIELEGEFDVFSGAVERYAEILGAGGMKVYRELAEAEWKKVPAQTAGEDSEWSKHFRIRHIMESLARTSGDIEQLVAVMKRHLSSAYDYWKITEVYREAGQLDNALLWAEKGIKAFPQRTDPRLREFAAEEYHRRERHDDAMKLIWTAFAEAPYLADYQNLERHARQARGWPEWRDRALAEIRRRLKDAKDAKDASDAQDAKDRNKGRGRPQPRWPQAAVDHSVLVEIYLHEGDAGQAWIEAQAGGCQDHLWIQLAAEREKDRPEDAAPIYWKQAEGELARGATGSYEQPVGLLVKAAAAMQRIGRSPEFVRNLEALRAKYKIRRNFIKLIEQNRKSLYLA